MQCAAVQVAARARGLKCAVRLSGKTAPPISRRAVTGGTGWSGWNRRAKRAFEWLRSGGMTTCAPFRECEALKGIYAGLGDVRTRARAGAVLVGGRVTNPSWRMG